MHHKPFSTLECYTTHHVPAVHAHPSAVVEKLGPQILKVVHILLQSQKGGRGCHLRGTAASCKAPPPQHLPPRSGPSADTGSSAGIGERQCKDGIGQWTTFTYTGSKSAIIATTSFITDMMTSILL